MYFKLIDKIPVPCTAEETFAASIDERRVAETTVKDVRISTVFLGVDHSFLGSDDQILFETMIFTGDDSGGDMERASTWLDAQTNHINAVNKVLGQ